MMLDEFTSAVLLPTWADRAACRGADVDVFFPQGPSRAARTYCATCPVRVDCLAFAMARPDLRGIWGGLTAAQRENRRRTT
jgi:WhiB family transcriptional regulator, redox-sensing transcriptional regulator